MNQNLQPAGRFMKFLQFPLTRIIMGFALLLIVPSVVQFGVRAVVGDGTTFADAVTVIVISITALLTYYGFVRVVERRPVSELALTPALRELPIGVLLGVVLFSLTIAILWLLGYYQVSAINPLQFVIPWLITGIISGIFEELLMRGILFRILQESLGTWLALILSALVFGGLHLANPNATLWAGLAIAIEAGVLLAAAYVYSRRLWIPIGIHFAWNFVQGGIFGVAVSGMESEGLLKSTLSGPMLLSGGEFGAEASIFAVIVCLSAGIYFLWMSYRQGIFIKPFWNRG
ncbi:MAG: CPBP family intramembrane glutamic endopeptidase [Anaerolineales bacterium]